MGLVALMLLHESRREARSDDNGEVVLLENQDRSLWNADLIGQGRQLVENAFRSGRPGPTRSGCDRGGARGGCQGGDDGLATDCRTVRRLVAVR